jgi:hypothetical protein
VLPRLTLDPWRYHAPTILTESRSLAGVLRPIARDYRCRIASTNGQCGGFLRTDIAPTLTPGGVVLYFGDFDWYGLPGSWQGAAHCAWRILRFV